MRHRSKKKILDRKIGPRTSLIRNMAASLIVYEKVKTTEAKAKVVARQAEKLITIAKKGGLVAKRELQAQLPIKSAYKKMIEVYVLRYQSRNGGYTRIIKLGRRQGDNAAMALIEFVQ